MPTVLPNVLTPSTAESGQVTNQSFVNDGNDATACTVDCVELNQSGTDSASLRMEYPAGYAGVKKNLVVRSSGTLTQNIGNAGNSLLGGLTLRYSTNNGGAWTNIHLIVQGGTGSQSWALGYDTVVLPEALDLADLWVEMSVSEAVVLFVGAPNPSASLLVAVYEARVEVQDSIVAMI